MRRSRLKQIFSDLLKKYYEAWEIKDDAIKGT